MNTKRRTFIAKQVHILGGIREYTFLLYFMLRSNLYDYDKINTGIEHYILMLY